jgi:CheY-like chemotaxis protein
VRLIAVTGYGDPEARQLAVDAGFDHHLVKPVDPDRLSEVLRLS